MRRSDVVTTRGAVMVEFALSLTFFVPLLFGVVSVGSIVQERGVAVNAVRMAGRVAAQMSAVGVVEHDLIGQYSSDIFQLTESAIREALASNNFQPELYTLSLQGQEFDYEVCLAAEDPDFYCPINRMLLELNLCSTQNIVFLSSTNCVSSRFIVEESDEPFTFQISGSLSNSGSG